MSDRQRHLARDPKPPMTPVPVYHPYTMADVHRSAARDRFVGVSFFCGGGGTSIGDALAGGRIALAADHDPEAVRTYERNFPGAVVVQCDVGSLAASQPSLEQFLALAGLRPGYIDILDFSPPCNEWCRLGPGVSTNGTAMLLFDSMRIARIARPSVVVVENVEDLVKMHGDALASALEELQFGEVGGSDRLYYAAAKVLSADDFGVPQRRRRVIIIGVRRDVAEAVGIASDEAVERVYPHPTHAAEPTGLLLPHVTARAAFAGLEHTKAERRAWLESAAISSLGRYIARMPRDPEDKTVHAWDGGAPKGTRFMLKRCPWNRPLSTITASSQAPDGRSGLVHPSEPRKLSIKELKRGTGLPEDFALTGTLAQRAQRIGNMVPPLLTKAIAENIYARVLKPYAERRAMTDKSAQSA